MDKEAKVLGKEHLLDSMLLPTCFGSSFEPKVLLEFFSPNMLQNVKEEDLEPFVIDDLVRYIQCKCSSFENSELMERTLELLPPGETWNRSTWENVTTVLDEWVDSRKYLKELECTTRFVGIDSLQQFTSGEEAGESWEKVLKCKLCSRIISVESFGNHLVLFHSDAVQCGDEIQQVEELNHSVDEESIKNKKVQLPSNGYYNIFSPLSPFFYGDDEYVAQLRQKDKERRRHLECRVLQYPQICKKRRRSLSEDMPTFSSKLKLQKDKKSANGDLLNTRKEGLGQDADEWLAPVMVTCASYVAGMHDLNKVEHDRTSLKQFPNHIDISCERVQNERRFENALHWLAKTRNTEGNISDCLERQRRVRETIYSHRKDNRINSFLTESGSLLVSKNEADLAIASAAFRSKMSSVRMDNNSPDVATLRNGNIGWNSAYYPRANPSAPSRLTTRPNQENRMNPITQPNLVDTKRAGVVPMGKAEVDHHYWMEGDNVQHMKMEMQSYSSQSKMPISASSQATYSLSSSHPRRFSSKGLPDNISSHYITMNPTSLSSEHLQQTTMQSYGGSKINYQSQHVNSPSMKGSESKASKGKRRSTKTVERGNSSGDQSVSYTNGSEHQKEAVSKSNTDMMPKEKFEGLDRNTNSVNTLRSASDPSSVAMFSSKSPRILSNAGMNASRNATAFPEIMGQRQAQVAPNKQLNELIGFVERKLNNDRSEQYLTDRSGISHSYYSGVACFGEDSGSRNYHENVNSHSPLEFWKQTDRRSVPKYETDLEGLLKEQSMKRESAVPNNYNLLWKDHISNTNFQFQRGQMYNHPKLASRTSSSKSNNNIYEEDYFNSSYGDNEGVFSPRSFVMDRSTSQYEYGANGVQPHYMEQSSIQELAESSKDAHRSGLEVAPDFQGQKASSLNLRNIQSTNSYVSADSVGLMSDSATTSYKPHVNKPIRCMDGNYPNELSKAVGPRNGQTPLRNVTFGSFGLNTVSATNIQRGGHSHPRQSGQQTADETYGILQNLRGGGSQSLSSLVGSSDTAVSSRKVNLPNASERIDAKQLHRLNSPNLASSPRLDNHSPSIDSRLTLSTGNLRRKEYRVRTNAYEDTNFGTNS
ncbi:hypothetical protein GpartN1_g5758.t1 [Galdieria partita]|uniref:Uncharacterized protein n=1 Tax=Galdieria partita TaxID=83374 RepID=A0A9C7Q1S4_9RHOD|nr:hypothetical protein GpartN1_g5758.t1 [Galdieria partita]